jgi:hypothetical protein
MPDESAPSRETTHDAWHDVAWMQRPLGAGQDPSVGTGLSRSEGTARPGRPPIIA